MNSSLKLSKDHYYDHYWRSYLSSSYVYFLLSLFFTIAYVFRYCCLGTSLRVPIWALLAACGSSKMRCFWKYDMNKIKIINIRIPIFVMLSFDFDIILSSLKLMFVFFFRSCRETLPHWFWFTVTYLLLLFCLLLLALILILTLLLTIISLLCAIGIYFLKKAKKYSLRNTRHSKKKKKTLHCF